MLRPDFGELLEEVLPVIERLEADGHRLGLDRGLWGQAELDARRVFGGPFLEALQFVAAADRDGKAIFEGHLIGPGIDRQSGGAKKRGARRCMHAVML